MFENINILGLVFKINQFGSQKEKPVCSKKLLKKFCGVCRQMFLSKSRKMEKTYMQR